MRQLREPPPQRPAFQNDGNLNLETHGMLRKILEHNVKHDDKEPTESVREEPKADDNYDESNPLPKQIFTSYREV